MKKLIIAFGCLVVNVYAQLPEEIQLEADSIEYSQNDHVLTATGNAILQYLDYTVTTNKFVYDANENYVEFPETAALTTKINIL